MSSWIKAVVLLNVSLNYISRVDCLSRSLSYINRFASGKLLFLLEPNCQRLIIVTMPGPLPVLFGATAGTAPHAPLLTTAVRGWPSDTRELITTRRSWYHRRQPAIFLQHDSHCAYQDNLELQRFKFWVLRRVFVIQK